MHRAAALVCAALCIPVGLARAQTPPPSHVLPAGTPLDFVADDSINVATVRPGGRFRIHLAHDLLLDGTPLASTGASAHLVVTAKDTRPDGSVALHLAMSDFTLRSGELPVTPLEPVVSALSAGTVIAAETLGSVERDAGRTVIRVPVPVPLSTDVPYAPFRPAAPKSPTPLLPPRARGATPTPLPTTFNPPPDSPAPEATATME